MNEKNLVKRLAAAAIILGIVFISVICIDTHESTSLSVKSSDTLKDGDAYIYIYITKKEKRFYLKNLIEF